MLNPKYVLLAVVIEPALLLDVDEELAEELLVEEELEETVDELDEPEELDEPVEDACWPEELLLVAALPLVLDVTTALLLIVNFEE